MNKVDVLLGLQWGDEGKGKIVDVLTPNYDIIARFNGGPNAGHTLEFNGIKHVLHIIPSGICRKEKENVIGNGVLIEPVIFQEEISSLEKIGFSPKDNLLISEKAHLIVPTHRLLDAANEKSKGDRKIGSTLKGIGPAYTDKIARTGIRIGDIFEDDFMAKYNKLKDSHIRNIKALGYQVNDFKIENKSLEEYEKEWFNAIDLLKKLKVINTEYYINEQIKQGKKVLAEGAQGTMLDIDFGSYPFVTSSSTVTAGVCSGLGIAPQNIGRVFGIVKAYCTRVGSGPFPTELFDNDGEILCQQGKEFGSTTGRKRRCGWLDLVALNYACMLNGVTDLILMKIDVLDDFATIKICNKYEIKGEKTEHIPYNMEENKINPIYDEYKGWKKNVSGVSSYNDLPKEMKDYIEEIEKRMNIPVSVVSISPDRKDTIFRKELK
ncbi:MAG: adenylosuccinate synthase [Bacteroidales bacterium]|jgi:adenylosuccinate synthase|nr:adenylosuccinate synthase [Bacteroidales bacterium]